MLLLLALSTAHAMCDVTFSREVFGGAVGGALEAYAAGDEQRYEAETWRAGEVLRCLHEPVDPRDAALLHLAHALHHLDRDDHMRARLYLSAAARYYDQQRAPQSVAHADLLTEARRRAHGEVDDGAIRGGGIVDGAWTTLLSSEGSARRMPPPTGGSLLIDGAALSDRPTETPFIFQRVRRNGDVGETSYFWPDGLDGALAVLNSDATSQYFAPAVLSPSYPRRRNVLAATALGAGLASGALFWAAAAQQATLEAERGVNHPHYDDPSYFEDLRRLNNRLYVSGVALGVVGGASAGLFVISWL